MNTTDLLTLDAVVSHSMEFDLIFNFHSSKSGGMTALPAPMVVMPLLTHDSNVGEDCSFLHKISSIVGAN